MLRWIDYLAEDDAINAFEREAALLRQYIVDPRELPWKSGQTEGVTFRCQVYLNGADGGPEAIRFRFDPCRRVYAHMHLTSQFQLLLGGTMDFPKSTMKLRPLAIHYADHNLPYGPFSTGEGHEMLVLHPKQGGLVSMADRAARKQINLAGRQLVAMDKDCEWFQFADQEGAVCKFLIPPGAGPEAMMVVCTANATMPVPAAPYGRYEVVLEGSISVEGRTLGAAALRYVVGDDQPLPIRIGSDGARLMLLSFDADAAAGGLGNDQLSRAAAEAIERAI